MSLFRDLLRTTVTEAGRVARRRATRAARRVVPGSAGPPGLRRRSGGGRSGRGRNDGSAPSASASLPALPGSIRTEDGRLSLPDRSGSALLRLGYEPVSDAMADPGEVVWTWVHYEETLHRGKDRPVLVIAREGPVLVALMLTSRDNVEGRHTDEYGNHWIDIGSGGWDPDGRPSEVRLDRLLRIDPTEVRRLGAVLPRDTFRRVADAVRDVHGW